MINTVSFEPEFGDRLTGLSSFRYGVLLSGSLGDEECLFLPIEVPNSTEDNSSSCRSPPKSASEVDARWVGSHCRNLKRMIPGGLRISGLCFVAKPNELTFHQTHIKKILHQIDREDNPFPSLMGKRVRDLLVLSIDPTTKKFICKAIDMEKPDSSFRVVSVKIRPVLSRWKAFKTHITLSVETPLPSDRKKEKILHQLQAAVEPYLRSLVTETRLLVNGEIHQDDEQLFLGDNEPIHDSTSTPTKQSKRSRRHKHGGAEGGDGAGGRFRESDAEKGLWVPAELTIFGPKFPRWQRASSSSSLDSGTSSDAANSGYGEASDHSSGSEFVPVNRLIVHGRIPGLAFLPAKTTVGELLQALREDLIYSVLARLQLLTEELHITSAELEVPRMLLPQRVLVHLPACPSLPLSDYKFLSETSDDVIARLRYFCVPLHASTGHRVGLDGEGHQSASPTESCSTHTSYSATEEQMNLLLGPLQDRIDASCLDTSLEKSPEGSADDDYPETELTETRGGDPKMSHHSWRNIILFGSGVFFLFLGLIFAYMFTSQH